MTDATTSAEIYCPTCATVFPGRESACPKCRRCPQCGALLFDEAPELCPSCEHPQPQERLERLLNRLDPKSDKNQRELRKLQTKQQNRDLIGHLNMVLVGLILLAPTVICTGTANVAGWDTQWVLYVSFACSVPLLWWTMLFQLRRGNWTFLLRSGSSLRKQDDTN